MKSCFFIGHREADEWLLPRLKLVIDRLIREENVRYFYVGGYGGFDRIAATAVKRAKQKYPDINEYNAFLCEIEGRSSLCWTLSPERSCVIEYSTKVAEEADIWDWPSVFHQHLNNRLTI